jgi:ATP-dependent DNA helicase PIF1
MTWKLRPRAKPRVINYFPRYKNNPRVKEYSDYCRVKLMLHHLFINWDDLLSVDGQVYDSYVDAFHTCEQQHVHPEDFYTDLDESGLGVDSDSDSDLDTDSDDTSDEDSDNNHPLADFEILACRRPRDDFPHVNDEGVGYQDMDHNYDWSKYVGQYNHPFSIWNRLQAENLIDQCVTVDSSPEGLNTEQ